MEKRTNKSILNELQTRRELLAQIIKRKMGFFGYACRNILRRNIRVTENSSQCVNEVVQMERLTSEPRTPTIISII